MLSRIITYGQWADDFADGDFTQAPEWSGEREKFEIVGEVLHLNDGSATGAAYLSTPSEAVALASWEFYIEISENPSASNLARIYIMADQANVAGDLNGYYVRVGGSEDEVSLYRQDGSRMTKLIDGSDGRVDTKPVKINVRVTRDLQGHWELFTQAESDPDFISEGITQDNTHTVSHYVGLYCQYTSTRKEAFYFDNFFVQGIPQPDITPPALEHLSILSATQWQLTFSEEIDPTRALVPTHYRSDHLTVSEIHLINSQTVRVTWSEPLTNGQAYPFQVSNVSDRAGNVLADTTLHTVHFIAVDAQWQDVVLNELMPDPNPVVANLPEAEFVELYNRSSHPFQLQNWRLNDQILSAYLLQPGQHLILCPAGVANDFDRYGNVLTLERWPALPNGGSSLSLSDSAGSLIDSLQYLSDAVAGGYTLERIRADRPCDQRINYALSQSPQGGTPGAPNTQRIDQPDTQAPQVQQLTPATARQVHLRFNEAVAATEVRIALSPEVEITRVEPDSADERILIINTAEDLVSGTTYTLTVQHARDCYGNEARPLTPHFYYDDHPPAIRRVVLYDTATLDIVFDKPLRSAGEKTDYQIPLVGEARLVQQLDDSSMVRVHFPASLVREQPHRLNVMNATDRYGNVADSLVYDFVFRSDIDTIRVVSAYQVNVRFTPALQASSAQSAENYRIDQGLTHPSAAILLSPREVQLIYDRPLVDNKVHTLRIEHLMNDEGVYLSTPAYRFIYDQRSPTLDSVTVLDNRTLIAHFNEPMAWEETQGPTAFEVTPSVGSPERVELLPDGRSFRLYLQRPLASERAYELAAVGLADWAGNLISRTTKKSFWYDQRAPTLLRGRLTAPDQLRLTFHEPLTASVARVPQHYTVAPDRHPDSVAVSTIYPGEVILFFVSPLPTASFSLHITGLADEYGNVLAEPLSIAIDPTVPTLGQAVVLSATELRLDFTKPLNKSVMEQLANYHRDSLDLPEEAVVVGPYQASVILRWEAPSTAGREHSIRIRQAAAQDGTASEMIRTSFAYDPKVAQILVDEAGLTVEFAVPLDTTATEASHYDVTGLGTPVAAILTDPQTVRLVFAQPFTEQSVHTLTLRGLLDRDKNIIPRSQHTVGLGKMPSYHQLLITEVMADPSPTVGLPDAEYVELFNASDQVLSTQGLHFSDASTTVVLPALLLAPQEYVLLCHTADQAALAAYGRTLAVGGLPTLNSGGDSLKLADAYGQEIFSINYADDWYRDAEKKSGGWSLEMVDTQRPCGEQENWIASVAIEGGTPGQENSVRQSNPDRFGPEVRQAWAINDTVVWVTFNEKLEAASTRSVQLQFSDGLSARAVQWFPSRKAVMITVSQPLRTGRRYSVQVGGVTDCSGNLMSDIHHTATWVLPEQAEAGDILLSELLFRPRSGGEKFVELYNHSQKQIDLKGWRLSDSASESDSLGTLTMITEEPYLLAPGAYVALTEDPAAVKADYPASPDEHLLRVASLPSLPAEEGTVVLLNPARERMQQFHYTDDYHHPLLDNTQGVSLERITWDRPVGHPDVWQSAAKTVGYATPGYRNSQLAGEYPQSVTLQVDPPVIAPGYPGHADYTRIHYQFDEPGAVANVIIYDAQGRRVRELAHNVTLSREGFLVWDGTYDDQQRAGIGYYLIFFEVFDTQGHINVFKEKVVVGGRW